MEYKEIVSEISKRVNLPAKTVDKVYRAYWKAVKQHIVSLPLKDELSDEEFLKLQPNVNIPSIGKLYITLESYQRKKKQFRQHLEKINKKDNNAEN